MILQTFTIPSFKSLCQAGDSYFVSPPVEATSQPQPYRSPFSHRNSHQPACARQDSVHPLPAPSRC